MKEKRRLFEKVNFKFHLEAKDLEKNYSARSNKKREGFEGSLRCAFWVLHVST